ncbi:hypothetical protein ABKV19_022905 [Rosa sericea]
MSSQHNTSRDPCYDPEHDNEVIGNIGGELSDLYEVVPGIYFLYGGPFLMDHRDTYSRWKTQGYYNDFTEDSDKESAEGKQGDGMLASTEEAEAETGINNFCGYSCYSNVDIIGGDLSEYMVMLRRILPLRSMTSFETDRSSISDKLALALQVSGEGQL